MLQTRYGLQDGILNPFLRNPQIANPKRILAYPGSFILDLRGPGPIADVNAQCISVGEQEISPRSLILSGVPHPTWPPVFVIPLNFASPKNNILKDKKERVAIIRVLSRTNELKLTKKTSPPPREFIVVVKLILLMKLYQHPSIDSNSPTPIDPSVACADFTCSRLSLSISIGG
ncbi:hypothetical protein JTE90_007732 [Oedothorax gibbosus]|uniref:Uncharacterized protein n=1 Tax=Oedothorax gibbosus TaxID=931172 RepID=A0AAV6V8L1_9ARAC|nr:hypothetical protein JTE90_007732 [Oedothorax gibbosus]